MGHLVSPLYLLFNAVGWVCDALLGRLLGGVCVPSIRAVDEGEAHPERHALAGSSAVEAYRVRAREAGFVRRGWVREDWPRRSVLVEVWSEERGGTSLYLTSCSYMFVSRRRDGRLVLTHSAETTHSVVEALALDSTGSFQADRVAHQSEAAPAWPLQGLGRHAARLDAIYRHHLPYSFSLEQAVPPLPRWLTVAAMTVPLLGLCTFAFFAVPLGIRALLGEFDRLAYLGAVAGSLAALYAFGALLSWPSRELRPWVHDEETARRAFARAVAPGWVLPRRRASALRCPYCHDRLSGRPVWLCCACRAAHHAPCWGAHGRCASCGRERGRAALAEAAAGDVDGSGQAA